MDNDIRESLHMEMAGDCTEQEFITAYENAHLKKYGQIFTVN